MRHKSDMNLKKLVALLGLNLRSHIVLYNTMDAQHNYQDFLIIFSQVIKW